MKQSAIDHSSRPNSVPPNSHPHNLFPSQILPFHLLGLRNISFIRDSPPKSVLFLFPAFELYVQSIVSSFYSPNNNLQPENCTFHVFRPAVLTYLYILLSSLHIIYHCPVYSLTLHIHTKQLRKHIRAAV
jgi:hypothetical protein